MLFLYCYISELNKKLVSSLFFRKLDAEEIDTMFIYDKSYGNNNIDILTSDKSNNYPSKSTCKLGFSKKEDDIIEKNYTHSHTNISDIINDKKNNLTDESRINLSQNEKDNYFGNYNN